MEISGVPDNRQHHFGLGRDSLRPMGREFIAEDPLLFEILAKNNPALIQRDEQGWAVTSDRFVKICCLRLELKGQSV
jgi:hypothetical protein